MLDKSKMIFTNQ